MVRRRRMVIRSVGGGTRNTSQAGRKSPVAGVNRPGGPEATNARQTVSSSAAALLSGSDRTS